MVAWLARSRTGRRQNRRPPAPPATSAAAHLGQLVGGSYRAHESLVAAVLEYLALNGIPAIPVFTGPRVTPREGGGFNLRANPGQRGFSDVAAALPPDGQLALIECKTGEARRSRDQVELQARFRTAGALCLVVRNALDLQPYVTEAKRRGRLRGDTDVRVVGPIDVNGMGVR
jgi:hypothetical protein